MLLCTLLLPAQGANYLTVAPPQKVVVKRGTPAQARIEAELMSGFHVNSDKPAEAYLIPLRLRWETGALEAATIAYPKPELHNYSFSEKAVSVFTGKFPIVTTFRAAEHAPGGPGVLGGKLRYQACTEDRCFPPKTVDIKLPYSIQ